MTYNDVIHFWFKEIAPKAWWTKDPDFDQELCNRFAETHQRASQCELFEWRSSVRGALAEILVLDQFSRNMFREQPRAFAQDALALSLAQHAVGKGYDQSLSATEKAFLYMPYMHSESLVVHEQAVKLFSQPGIEGHLDFELKHKAIIEKFGRYPHRNGILGRPSTKEEQAFLQTPGSSF